MKTKWRVLDLCLYFVFLAGAAAFVVVEAWGLALFLSGCSLLQLAEAILHAVADAEAVHAAQTSGVKVW